MDNETVTESVMEVPGAEVSNQNGCIREKTNLEIALENFGAEYAAARGKNLTQAKIGEMTGLDASTISRIETGHSRNVSAAVLDKAATAVGGNLRICLYGDMTATLPKELHERATELAKNKEVSTSEYLTGLLTAVVSVIA